MKKVSASVFVIAMALAGCGSSSASESGSSQNVSVSQTSEQVELVIFAAASMTESLEEIQTIYETTNPDIKITYNFESSGTLKTQIENGAECDVFISAAPKQMNQLDITQDEEKNPDRLDLIDPDTRINLLENKVVLVVPEDNPLGIENFDDLADKLKNDTILFAMGNSDVPVGQYTQKIFAYYDLDEEQLANDGKITYGSNVKDVVSYV
ncbi:MAG: molybdate ABC transporter substrate-binding protein, partial [Solobacterium sp.]|nr:molybdate ABC transporter substrate-binding protein [Solobacterium sp.]